MPPGELKGVHGGGVTICTEECTPRGANEGVRGWGHHMIGGVYSQRNHRIYTNGVTI